MGRSIGAVVFGLVVAGIWLFAIQTLIRICIPPPAELDLNDQEAVGRFFTDNPRMLLGVAGGYLFSTFIGGWLGGRTAKRNPTLHGLIVGLVWFGIGVTNLLSRYSYPAWFWVVGPAMFLLGGALGGWVAGRTQASPTPDLTS